MISKGLGIAALIVAMIGAGMLWMTTREKAAERRGADQQVARDIAAANQNIATKRETDAKFDSQDAHALCNSYGLDWVQREGKSFCE